MVEPQSFEEIVEWVRGIFGVAGVQIRTSVESKQDRLTRIAGQIAAGERTLAEVQLTVQWIAVGWVGFKSSAPPWFGGTGQRSIGAASYGSVSGSSLSGEANRAPVVTTTTSASKLAANDDCPGDDSDDCPGEDSDDCPGDDSDDCSDHDHDHDDDCPDDDDCSDYDDDGPDHDDDGPGRGFVVPGAAACGPGSVGCRDRPERRPEAPS